MKLQNFRRLWLGMTISSLGDWIGFFALLAITNRLAPRNSLAVAGLMMARMLPAFVIGPIAGVALDRLDKRKAMIVADLLRAALIASVPFLDTLPGLYAVAFLLETCALVWMPAKDALVPSLVPARWLVAANSLALFSTYGVFPLGALVFTGLVGTGQFLGAHFESLRGLGLNQENLALWIDTATFLVSVLLVSRIQFPGLAKSKRPIRLSVIWDELTEGLRYFRQRGEITRIVRGIGFALVGGGVIFSLGVPYTTEVLHGGAKGFGAMVAFLGTGMGVGVLLLGLVGHRLSKAWVFASGIISGGLALSLLSVVDRLELAIPVACALGACAGVAYATGFALLQEKVAEEVRGRTFASVQIVIRVSLFLSLTSFPALAELFSTQMSSEDGIRLSMAVGGLLSVAAGTLIARDVFKRRIES
ncbi:MAG TPA: MFS transporter [Actinomycetota bacterium]|nr:MFS transporter [Actinomycetota bacterium]